jgi:hypothetical protein
MKRSDASTTKDDAAPRRAVAFDIHKDEESRIWFVHCCERARRHELAPTAQQQAAMRRINGKQFDA